MGAVIGSTDEAWKTIFHGNQALRDDRTPSFTIRESLGRDLKAILKILFAKEKTVAIAEQATLLPLGDPLRNLLTKFMVNTLWSSLLHPPLSYKGAKFQYRAADGSNNNFMFPELGKAGLPYAKTVQGQLAVPGSKPDPGDLFDLLLARKETGGKRTKESDLGLSSMLLYHATVIIHDIFRTNRDDKNISDTSSYLDLSPLYGRDLATQRAVRTMKNGLLKPDTFAEERLLNQPPGVCIYLIMYNRFHNYVAQQLLSINEKGKFTLPRMPVDWTHMTAQIKPGQLEEVLDALWMEDHYDIARKNRPVRPKEWRPYKNSEIFEERIFDKAASMKQDEDLFQTARLITCGLYINISIHDYLRVLMRKHAVNTNWTLDPRIEIPFLSGKEGIRRGIGNQVTAEFNVLYRFHSPLSMRDTKWSSDFIKWRIKKDLIQKDLVKVDNNEGENTITQEQFESAQIPVKHMVTVLKGLYEDYGTVQSKEGEQCWPKSFGGSESGSFDKFTRGRDGKFNDEDLVKEMCEVMEDPICQFGAQNIPQFFRSIEILGILQARKWELATLNEFREFFGMNRHADFSDINSDPEIAGNLRKLYGHPDCVELYPGLVCEGQGRCLDPGTNCPNGSQTALWRGVFSDAVTLVRSDRFYTVDWNVDSLTAWGMNEVSSDPKIFKGGVISRLFQRAFPGFFTSDSIHMWQPFYTPAMNIIVAQDTGVLGGLEPTKNLGVSREEVVNWKSSIEQLRKALKIFETTKSSPKNDWPSGIDVTDMEELHKTHVVCKAKGDMQPLYNQMRFKLLRNKAKMPHSKIQRAAPMTLVSNYETIQNVLSDEGKSVFKNPAYASKESIPFAKSPLRDVLLHNTAEQHLRTALTAIQALGKDQGLQSTLMQYFASVCTDIRRREEQELQKIKRSGREVQVYQMDVINDYAIPVITRFVADFLGFGHLIKTREQHKRPYDENQIYQHLLNCQDFLSFDANRAHAYKKRVAFEESIEVLKKLAEDGVADMQKGWFDWLVGRSYRKVAGDHKEVIALRKFAATIAQQLVKKIGQKTAAAVMLAAALDAIHKSVLMFTEVLQFLLDEQNGRYWEAIQNSKDEKVIRKYVLEAQRLHMDLPLVRKYMPSNDNESKQIVVAKEDGQTKAFKKTLRKGDTILLQIHEASKEPSTLDLQYDDSKYILYGSTGAAASGAPNSSTANGHSSSETRSATSPLSLKNLTILAVTGLVTHLSQLSYLRRAHDLAGRVAKASTPPSGHDLPQDRYRERYLSIAWDELVPFPTTWSLRYDGVGKGVWTGGDNSRVGHGMVEVGGLDVVSARGGGDGEGWQP